MELVEFLIPMLSAAVYALAFYLKRYQEDGVAFDFVKFGSTLILGLVIGVVSVYSGIGVSSETVIAQFAAYAGFTAVIESVIKMLWRAISGNTAPVE